MEIAGIEPIDLNPWLYNACMTFREYLIRRNRKVLIPAAVIMLTVMALAEVAPNGSIWKSRTFYAFPLLIALIAVFANRARCPRCNARLGYIDLGGGRSGRAPRVGLDRCLSCGLHPKEEISAPPQR